MKEKQIKKIKKQIFDQWKKDLAKDRKLVVRGFGTFFLLPRRKGKIYCADKKPKHKYRVKFVPSRALKKLICD